MLCKINYFCSSLIIEKITSEKNKVTHEKLIDVVVGTVTFNFASISFHYLF
jgi:hypothetical protein